MSTPASPPAAPSSAPDRSVSARALIVGLLLVPVNVYWVIVAELRWYTVLTLNPLFVTPIFYLFVLAGVNVLLRRHAPRLAFSGADLAVIYILLVLSCTVATHDFIINLMSSIGWPRWFATPENGWEQTMFAHLPKWLFVWDKELLSGAMKGNGDLYRLDVLRMWAAPLAFWSVFILSVGWIMLCLNVLLRRAWVEHTRLSFPIVRLPLALTEHEGAGQGIRSRALWIGFGAIMLLDLMNGLHEWFPALPFLPTRAIPLQFPSAPWNSTWPLFLTFYPFGIGLAFLVPLDVSFSCWFFYAFVKLQSVIGVQLGYGETPDFPYVSEQGMGAWYAFGLVLAWGMRRHMAAALRTALRDDGADRGEMMRYRTAFIGLVIGIAVFAVFWWAAGMSPLLVAIVLVSYLLLSICITRVRAEAGGQHTVWDLEPMRMARLVDSRALGPANLATAAMSHWYWRLNRSHVMPSQLEAMKLAQDHGIRLKSLAWPMMLAFTLASVVGMWACLHVFYGDGARAKCLGFANWTGVETFDWLGASLGAGHRQELGRWGAVGASAGLIAVLSMLRARFAGFAFHPLGYCIGPGLIWLWAPFFIAWLLKLVILRYGGLKLYRRALPFFLGMVLGDYTAGAIWSLVGVIGNVPVYQIFH